MDILRIFSLDTGPIPVAGGSAGFGLHFLKRGLSDAAGREGNSLCIIFC